MSDYSIAIDLSELRNAMIRVTNPRLDLLNDAIKAAALLVRETWQRAVQGEMLPGMTRAVQNDDYYESLHTGESLRLVAPLHAVVVSTYPGTERVEQGYGAYDMKPALLNGPSSRAGRHGRYNVVPFRFMTPKNAGAVGGEQENRAHGRAMPADIYRIVKKSGAFVDPGNARLGAQVGQRSKIAAVVNIQALARDMPGVMTDNSTWKNGLYTGMRRVVKTYGTRTQSTYWTWRAVSEASDPNSWVHPGVPPNPVIQAVIDATRADVERLVQAGARAAYGLT